MKIIKFIILITFLFNNTAYPYQNISDTLRSNLMTQEGKGTKRLQDTAAQVILKDTKPPSVGHVEKIADAYNAAKAGNYDRAYELLMEGLLGEDYVVNIETAIGVLQALQAHYGIDTQRGKELGGILEIVIKHKTARDQVQMKAELKQYQDSLEIAEAKKAIEERFKTTKEGEKTLKLVENLAIRLADKAIKPGNTLQQYNIHAIVNAAKDIKELEELLVSIKSLVTECANKRIASDKIYFAVREAIRVWKQYGSFRIKYEYVSGAGYEEDVHTYSSEGTYYTTAWDGYERTWVETQPSYYEIRILPPMFPVNLINQMRRGSRDQL